MRESIWKKAYKGPFGKDEAERHAYSLKHDVPFKENQGVIDAAVRRRRAPKNNCVCTAACGAGLGHNQPYDVWIKTNVLDARSI